jgi:hypothetical protein
VTASRWGNWSLFSSSDLFFIKGKGNEVTSGDLMVREPLYVGTWGCSGDPDVQPVSEFSTYRHEESRYMKKSLLTFVITCYREKDSKWNSKKIWPSRRKV